MMVAGRPLGAGLRESPIPSPAPGRPEVIGRPLAGGGHVFELGAAAMGGGPGVYFAEVIATTAGVTRRRTARFATLR